MAGGKVDGSLGAVALVARCCPDDLPLVVTYSLEYYSISLLMLRLQPFFRSHVTKPRPLKVDLSLEPEFYKMAAQGPNLAPDNLQEKLTAMHNVPLFMRSLPSGDKTGAEDTVALEALRALIHEGTPDGVCQFHLDRVPKVGCCRSDRAPEAFPFA
jgi:hypothetical protein